MFYLEYTYAINLPGATASDYIGPFPDTYGAIEFRWLWGPVSAQIIEVGTPIKEAIEPDNYKESIKQKWQ